MLHTINMTDFSNSYNDTIQSWLTDYKNKSSFSQLQIGPLQTSVTIDFYEKWIGLNYQGEMNYLKTHMEFKKNPHLLNQKIQSVISIAQSYYPAVKSYAHQPPARIALYAQNEDYHHWLKSKLQDVIAELSVQYPTEVFLPYVDSGPILERELAYKNALGWFGKNTCLIHPQHGSLFFIAEILTSLKCENKLPIEPIPDFCGKCQKCIEICPTKALVAPQTLKADLCISYLTIEARTIPPAELRPLMGDWFFGCDLCQTTCPWNEKVFRSLPLKKVSEVSTELKLNLNPDERQKLIEYFVFLLTASHKKIAKYHVGTPLSRAGAKGLKRNSLIVIGNQKLYELKTQVELQLKTELAELAEWTLQILKT